MSTIALHRRNGSVRALVLVDPADYAWLNQWRWSLSTPGRKKVHHKVRPIAVRTVRIQGKKTNISMHRQIMGFPEGQVDHKNGDTLDNRRSNLRLATNAQNRQNQHEARSDSTTGIRGVTYDRERRLYRAHATLDGRHRFLGYHKSIELAAEAVSAWRSKHMPYSEADQ